MKKPIEIKKDTNYTVRVFGKGLAVFFNHRLIRFSVAAHDEAGWDETLEIRQIDETNAALCRASVSEKALTGFLRSGASVRGFLFLDRASGEPIGYDWLFFEGAHDSEYTVRGHGDAVLISYIYVFDAFRGKRMIAHMLSHAFSVCRELGVGFLYASVRKNNASAWKAYDRIGFEEMGARRFVRLLGHNIPKQYIP